jgi:hypothetical protein
MSRTTEAARNAAVITIRFSQIGKLSLRPVPPPHTIWTGKEKHNDQANDPGHGGRIFSWAVMDFVIHGVLLKATYNATAELWRAMGKMKMP